MIETSRTEHKESEKECVATFMWKKELRKKAKGYCKFFILYFLHFVYEFIDVTLNFACSLKKLGRSLVELSFSFRVARNKMVLLSMKRQKNEL